MGSKRPPELNSGVTSSLIIKLFPFTKVSQDSFKQFPSYYDRNTYFEGTEEGSTEPKAFVLKVNHFDENIAELVEGQSKMMVFVKSRGFMCAEPIATRTGNYVHLATEQELLGGGSVAGGEEVEGVKYPVRILRYIPGEIMDKVDSCLLSPQLRYSIGTYAGRMDHTLQEFHHAAIDNNFDECWDIQHFTHLKKYIPHIGDEQKREKARTVMAAYEAHILPNLPSMRKGVIHGDVSGLNLILQKDGDQYKFAGLIDFGQCVRTCYLSELAIMIAYGMMERESPVEFVAPMIHGYQETFPLSREELGCLYYAVVVRLCQSAVSGEYRFTQEPWNTYLLTTPVKAWKLIDLFLTLTKERVEKIWGLWD